MRRLLTTDKSGLLCAGLLLSAWISNSNAGSWQQPSGHLKYQVQVMAYPENSVYRSVVGDQSQDQLLDNRWKFAFNHQHWDVKADYDLQAYHGDRLLLAPAAGYAARAFAEDTNRLFDLTHVIHQQGESAIVHRLDRLNVGYTSDRVALRIGRQVLSWGNGLLFNPMDFFNPFDPAALDKEYKTGDDMVYGQYLLPSGNDLQAVWVGRRDPMEHDISSTQNSTAFKYHQWLSLSSDSFWSGAELDWMLAKHYDDDIIGLGLIKSLGGAVWRSDLTFTHTVEETFPSFVSNLSYSWIWNQVNWSGVIEYFYNGVGISGDRYTLADILAKPDLINRLQRGELFSTGRQYLAASASIELTPLWLATPVLFFNLEDQSALLQLGSQFSLAQNWELLGAVNLPMGPAGTEYGGLNTGFNELALTYTAGFFLQLAFYY